MRRGLVLFVVFVVAAHCALGRIGNTGEVVMGDVDLAQVCPKEDDRSSACPVPAAPELLLLQYGTTEAASSLALPCSVRMCAAENTSMSGVSIAARTAIEHLFEHLAPSAYHCGLHKLRVVELSRLRSVELLVSMDDQQATMFRWYPAGHLAPFSLGVMHTVWLTALDLHDGTTLHAAITMYEMSRHTPQKEPKLTTGSAHHLPPIVSIRKHRRHHDYSLSLIGSVDSLSLSAAAVEFSLLNYNLWNFNGDWSRRLGRLLSVIEGLPDGPPDVLTLQELRIDNKFAARTDNATLRTQCQADHVVRALRHHLHFQHSFTFAPAMSYFNVAYGGAQFQLEGPMLMHTLQAAATGAFFLSRHRDDQSDAHQRLLLCAVLIIVHDGRFRGAPTVVRVDVCTVHFALDDRHRLRNSIETSRLIEELAQCRATRCVSAMEGEVYSPPTSFPSAPLPPASMSILTGDLNGEPQDKAVSRFMRTEGFVDSFEVWRKQHHGGADTAEDQLGHTFNANDKLSKRIDFVLLKPRNVTTPNGQRCGTLVSVVRFSRVGRRSAGVDDAPSDHLGIAVKLRLDFARLPE